MDKLVLTVVVVDDDNSVLRATKRLLISNGHQVLTFDSAEDLLHFGPVPGRVCLLLDICLPGISGLELYSALVSGGTESPVIFMTALDEAEWGEKAEKLGAVAFLHKPFGEQQLLDALALASSR